MIYKIKVKNQPKKIYSNNLFAGSRSEFVLQTFYTERHHPKTLRLLTAIYTQVTANYYSSRQSNH